MSSQLSWFFICWLVLPTTIAANETDNTTVGGGNTADTYSILKPPFTKIAGCPSKCGNLTIPYPFGIGKDCGINSWFDITCNTSFTPPKPQYRNMEIYDISDIRMRLVSRFMASICYNSSGEMTGMFSTWNYLGGAPFSFSNANKFFIIGCDDVGYIGPLDWASYTGCISSCSEVKDVTDRSCSGIGCCQATLPKGLKFYTSNITSLNRHSKVYSFNPCSYAFVGEANRFEFGGVKDLNDPEFPNRILATVPIVVEWEIGNSSCAQARKRKDYACKANSFCVDTNTALGGYRCRCNGGYDGNPYLDGGCQDIDECADPNNPCEICINFPGGFSCSCPHGNRGNGKRGGCIRDSSSIKIIIGIAVGGTILGILFLVTASVFSYKTIRRRRERKLKEKIFKRNGGLLLQQQMCVDHNIVEKVKLFTAVELGKATNNFHENRILGHGGQGTVYKGMLVDGKIVAVKKSILIDENQVKQFINEVVVLSQIVHRNVVKLLGCCLETNVPLLVYEFIPNGTLYNLIHNESYDEFLMSWDMRLRIATEIAGALAYLHSATTVPVYHRDIKSSNILLDEKYVAKLSDFGTSKHITIDQTHLTTLVKGTFGYLDPEYFQLSQFTEKSDVYSFGVVLVELLTRQKPITSTPIDDHEGSLSLASRFLISMEKDRLDMILDTQILETASYEQVVAVAKLSQRCLSLDGKKRPTMKEVAMQLESIKMSHHQSTVVETNFEGESSSGIELVVISDGSPSWTTTNDTIITSSSDSCTSSSTHLVVT